MIKYFQDEESGKEVTYEGDAGRSFPAIYLGSIGDDYDVMRVIKVNEEEKIVHYLTISNGEISTRW